MNQTPQTPQPKSPQAQEPGNARQKPDANVERVVLAAMKTIYDKGILQQLLTVLRSGEPAEGLAQATLFVMKGLFEASKGTMPPATFLPAVQMVMPLIAEIGEAAGIAKADEALVKQAATIFAQLIKQESSGGKQAAAPAAPEAAPQQPGQGLIQSAMGA